MPATLETPLVAKFQLTRRDLRRAARAALLRKWWFGPLLLLGALGVVVGVTMSAGIDYEDPNASMCSCHIAMSGLIVLILLPVLYLVAGAIRRMPKGFFEPQEFHFTPDEVETKSMFGSSKVKWDRFTKARESSRYYLLSVARRRSLVLPKRAIAPDEVTAFRAVVTAGMGRRAHLEREDGWWARTRRRRLFWTAVVSAVIAALGAWFAVDNWGYWPGGVIIGALAAGVFSVTGLRMMFALKEIEAAADGRVGPSEDSSEGS